jgi:DNA-binding NtrC family response regulator
VDVRILSATNANLHADSAQGRFRQDLLYRLNTVEIHLPPLRERKEDIPLLATAHLATMARRYRKEIKGFAPAALRSLTDHPWPGNVRELMHVVERAVLMAHSDAIQPADLALRAPAAPGRLEEMSIEEVEEFLIRKALARHDGNVSHAAEALGLSRSALYRRLQRYRI